jgi:hypothetical protein
MGCCSCIASFGNRGEDARRAKKELGLSQLSEVDMLTQGEP